MGGGHTFPAAPTQKREAEGSTCPVPQSPATSGLLSAAGVYAGSPQCPAHGDGEKAALAPAADRAPQPRVGTRASNTMSSGASSCRARTQVGTRLPPALEKQTRGEATKRCLCPDIPQITDSVRQLHTPCSAPHPVWVCFLFFFFATFLCLFPPRIVGIFILGSPMPKAAILPSPPHAWACAARPPCAPLPAPGTTRKKMQQGQGYAQPKCLKFSEFQ